MKKTNTNAFTEENLKELMTKYSNVSLRALSQQLKINYSALLKASKTPIPGEMYDPDNTNYTALFLAISKRDKVDELVNLDWELLNEARNSRSTLIKDINQFTVGSLVYLRENNETPFEVIYKTDTCIVVMLQGTSEPRVFKNNTFLLKGPSAEPRTVTTTEKVEQEDD